MANFITIIRIFFAFIAIALLFTDSILAYLWSFGLTSLAFLLDGIDGYVARKFNETSKLGAMLDIMSDRIVENSFWVAFAVLGWLPIFFPIIALTRGFITDGIRSVALQEGYTAFGTLSMQKSKVGNFICCSNFSRASYAVSKLTAFILLIIAGTPYCDDELFLGVYLAGYIAAIIALEFCVIRALPVIFEAKQFFVKEKTK